MIKVKADGFNLEFHLLWMKWNEMKWNEMKWNDNNHHHEVSSPIDIAFIQHWKFLILACHRRVFDKWRFLEETYSCRFFYFLNSTSTCLKLTLHFDRKNLTLNTFTPRYQYVSRGQNELSIYLKYSTYAKRFPPFTADNWSQPHIIS